MVAFGAARNNHRYHGSAALTGLYGHTPAAHHFKALPNVIQSDMRLIVIGGLKISAVILHYNPAAGACPARFDEDVKRFGILTAFSTMGCRVSGGRRNSLTVIS